jgi:hypothetical protein
MQRARQDGAGSRNCAAQYRSYGDLMRVSRRFGAALSPDRYLMKRGARVRANMALG